MSVYQSGIPTKQDILSSLGVLFLKHFKFSFPNNLSNKSCAVFWLQNVARVFYFVKFWNLHAVLRFLRAYEFCNIVNTFQIS